MEANELYLKELNERGRTLFSCDKYDEAIKVYEQALEIDPTYKPTYFHICEAYVMADRYEEATKMMNRVLLLDKNNGEAYFHLGNIALLKDEEEEGRLQYAKAINNGFDNPQIYINLGAVAEEKGEWEDAVSYFSKAIARDKLNYVAKIRKMNIYSMLHKNAEALACAEDLIETNPEIFEGHHVKFLLLATENRLGEAEATLDKAQKLFPDDQGFMLDRVKLYELKKDYERAMEQLELLDEKHVPMDVILTEKALLLMAMDRLDEAQAVLENYQGEITMSEMLRVLIVVYISKENFQGVLSTAERIIANGGYDTNYFAAHYFKAYAYKMLGKAEEAQLAYETALKLLQQACSINSGVLDLYVFRAICYKEVKNYDKAHEMLDYVETVQENIAETHYIRALIYRDLQDSRAEAEMNKAKTLNPEIANLLGE